MPCTISKTAPETQRVVFCLPAIFPGRCGVTDYSIRMACAFHAIGWNAVIVDGSTHDGVSRIHTSEGDVDVIPLKNFQCAATDVLSIQFVPNSSRKHWHWIKRVAALNPVVSHLMMHEFWRVATPAVPLTPREKIRAYPQRLQCEWLRARLAPDVISTSCRFYQDTLTKAGWPALLSPMPGNIPTNVDHAAPANLKHIEWFIPQRKYFTWVAFGSIYARYWDPAAYFLESRKLVDLGNHSPKWVIAGRQTPEDMDLLMRAAEQAGFSEEIEILGPCEPAEIDWLMKHADAAITGVSAVCWDKSGGVLAARERKLPVFAPVDGTATLADFLQDPAHHTQMAIDREGLHPQIDAVSSATILESMFPENEPQFSRHSVGS